MLIGRLGRDPELRYTPAGTAVCNFTMATDEAFKDKSGEWQKRTEWHRIVAWAKLAEQCSKLLNKGKLAYVEGRLQTREWDRPAANTRPPTEIVLQRMRLLRPKGEPGREMEAEGPEPP